MKSKKIIELNNQKAKEFFIDEKSYINFDVPDYFHFSELLNTASKLLAGKELSNVCKTFIKDKKPIIDYPKYHENVNYIFLSNKDGAFEWRPLQLIHPILYVDLVNILTTKNNWGIIVNKFNDFSNTYVECISIPRISQDKNSHKASQVKYWWEEIEQKSIKLSIEYEYIFTTDITNCYGSIYTHSLDWVFNGRDNSKDKIKQGSLLKTNNIKLGEEIDEKLRGMNYGQTNGIPQGSILMDFIAEMVLGYADIKLTEIIKYNKIEKDDFCILRYRDDYRIFTKDPMCGKKILKYLNSVLFDLGMKMNPNKTNESDDIILSSIKKEKLERIFISPSQQYYQKEALRIYQLSKKYQNSGIILKELNDYYDKIEKLKSLKNTDIDVLISIFVMISFNSPKAINWVSAIISILFKMIKSNKRVVKIIKDIHNKFKNIPNTSLVDVWLQRIAYPLGVELDYGDNLTKVATKKIDNVNIWESSWLKDDVVNKINLVELSDLEYKIKNKTISPVIERVEVELFKLSYND